jgi:hypothetical protein
VLCEAVGDLHHAAGIGDVPLVGGQLEVVDGRGEGGALHRHARTLGVGSAPRPGCAPLGLPARQSGHDAVTRQPVYEAVCVQSTLDLVLDDLARWLLGEVVGRIEFVVLRVEPVCEATDRGRGTSPWAAPPPPRSGSRRQPRGHVSRTSVAAGSAVTRQVEARELANASGMIPVVNSPRGGQQARTGRAAWSGSVPRTSPR